MKVIQINTRYKNGGSTGRIVYDLMRISEQQGIDAYVAYGYEFDNIHDEKTLCMNSWFELTISKLQSRIFARHGFYNIIATKRLVKFLDEIQPDVIHLHNLHNHYIHCGMLFDYIKHHNIPVIWTLHDCWSFTGWCAHFDYSQCNRWKSHCHNCPSKKQYPFTWFSACAKRNFTLKKDCFCGVEELVLVTPSSWLADLINSSFLNHYCTKVINNGVDTSIFRPCGDGVKKRIGAEGKTVYLAMAVGFSMKKGGDYLKQLPEMLHDDEILLLVGKGAKAQAALHSDKCIGIEYTNDVHELAEYYSAADVFINPTLEDNFPTTNIEAMACGTSVVSFNTGGSIESILDWEEPQINYGITMTSVGAVVEKGDIVSLLKASREIMNRGKSFYAENCRKKAVEHYNKDRQYQKYIDLYKSVLK